MFCFSFFPLCSFRTEGGWRNCSWHLVLQERYMDSTLGAAGLWFGILGNHPRHEKSPGKNIRSLNSLGTHILSIACPQFTGMETPRGWNGWEQALLHISGLHGKGAPKGTIVLWTSLPSIETHIEPSRERRHLRDEMFGNTRSVFPSQLEYWIKNDGNLSLRDVQLWSPGIPPPVRQAYVPFRVQLLPHQLFESTSTSREGI